MSYDRRYLKRISGFTAIQTAARQGWRAAEDMRGRNHYPVGSARYLAWQKEYDKAIESIERDMREFWDQS